MRHALPRLLECTCFELRIKRYSAPRVPCTVIFWMARSDSNSCDTLRPDHGNVRSWFPPGPGRIQQIVEKAIDG